MKAEEAASPKDGDVSPINRSLSNLAEETRASTSIAKPKRVEPSFETRPNFSRVTPAQLGYISFPNDGRYQPVRAVSTKTPLSKAGRAVAAPGGTFAVGLGSEKYAGGGGILILVDSRPEDEADFIDLQAAVIQAPAPTAVPAENGHAPGAQPSGRHIALNESEPEADPPESFEVRLGSTFIFPFLTSSILQYPFDNDT